MILIKGQKNRPINQKKKVQKKNTQVWNQVWKCGTYQKWGYN